MAQNDDSLPVQHLHSRPQIEAHPASLSLRRHEHIDPSIQCEQSSECSLSRRSVEEPLEIGDGQRGGQPAHMQVILESGRLELEPAEPRDALQPLGGHVSKADIARSKSVAIDGMGTCRFVLVHEGHTFRGKCGAQQLLSRCIEMSVDKDGERRTDVARVSRLAAAYRQ